MAESRMFAERSISRESKRNHANCTNYYNHNIAYFSRC